jgi:hypothetical protein
MSTLIDSRQVLGPEAIIDPDAANQAAGAALCPSTSKIIEIR